MRYRSRLRRNRLSAGTKKNIAAAAIIIIFAVAVFSIGAIGEFLARNIFVPLFGDVQTEPDGDISATGPAGPVKLTESISLNELSMFLVQLDAFNEQDEADESAKSVRERGGAGYIIEEDCYRVFAAAYNTEKQAQSVCEQLAEQDEKNAKVYPVTSGKVVFKITATREQIDAISKAFAYFPEVCAELADKTIEFDKGRITAAQYKTLAASAAQKLDELALSVNRIISGTSQNSILASYSQLLSEAAEKLENISVKNSVSGLAFSSEIKYNYIELAHMYINYVAAVKE